MNTVRWGILGPGRIARAFVEGLRAAPGAEIVAVGSRDRERAASFASEYGIRNTHGGYDDLVADPEVDAVYIATSHSFHHDHTLMCLRGGKHVLCEKPLALNAVQAERMIDAADEAGLLLMEGVWTRFLPAIERVRELVGEGAVGEVRSVVADFGFRAEFDPRSRLFSPALGGGALLDIGVYPINLAVMICGEPSEIRTMANLGETGVDEECAMLLRHDGGRLSVLTASFRADTPREARILGTEGSLTICSPWWAATRIVLTDGAGREETFELPSRGGGYAHEAEAFMDLIRSGSRDSAIMPLQDSLAVMTIMDEIRTRWGLTYPSE